MNLLIVGAGGFIGAVLRYVASLGMQAALGRGFPFGTLFVNTSGGLFMGLALASPAVSGGVRLFLITGVLGGFTTFSAFGGETVELFSQGKYFLGGLNILCNVAFCLLGVWLGHRLGQA